MYMRVMLQEGVADWTHVNSQWYNNDHYGNLDELVLRKESFNLVARGGGGAWSKWVWSSVM